MKSAHEKMIDRALAAGYCVSVFDGEEWQVKQGREKPAILAAIDSVDSSELVFRDPRQVIEKDGRKIAARIGWALVIPYGVGPDETIADHTDNAIMESLAGVE